MIVPRAVARGTHFVNVIIVLDHLALVSCILYPWCNVLDSFSFAPIMLHLFNFPMGHCPWALAPHNVLLPCNNLYVSLQHPPLHTRAKSHVPTPPRRQQVPDANEDFAEVSSPCPKVIHFQI